MRVFNVPLLGFSPSIVQAVFKIKLVLEKTKTPAMFLPKLL